MNWTINNGHSDNNLPLSHQKAKVGTDPCHRRCWLAVSLSKREGTLSSARVVRVTGGCVPACACACVRVCAVVNGQALASHQQAAKFIK